MVLIEEAPSQIDELTLVGVHAERFITGIYFSLSLAVPEGMQADDAMEAVHMVSLLDGNGDALHGGLSLSHTVNTDNFPTVMLESMSTLEAFPYSLIVTNGTVKVSLR